MRQSKQHTFAHTSEHVSVNLPDHDVVRELDALRVSEDGVFAREEIVAVESRADVVVDGVYWLSTSLSPRDVEDYVYGVLFSAGFINTVDDVRALRVVHSEDALVFDIEIDKARRSVMGAITPASPLRTAALLSTTAVDETLAHAEAVAYARQVFEPIEAASIWHQATSLLQSQGLHRLTGATHAATFANREGETLVMREDLGRHNAVDKLIGALMRKDIDPGNGFVYLSSRCALELVSKLAKIGVRLIATVSAPTTAAIDYAEAEGITLCAFAREGRFTIYTHAQQVDLGNLR